MSSLLTGLGLVARILAAVVVVGALTVVGPAPAAEAERASEGEPALRAQVLDDDDDDGDDEGDADDTTDDDTSARPTRPRPDGPDDGAPEAPSEPAAPAPVPADPPTSGDTARSPVPAHLLVRSGRVTPSLGRALTHRRPTLRWGPASPGVRVYNVQVFTAQGTKVLSAFTRSGAYRLPPRRLAHGRRYIWRVWPYMARGGYTTRPFALSWFATPPRPRESR